MEKLIVKYDSLDGEYRIEVNIDQDIDYVVDSTIAYIVSKQGTYKENKEVFLNKLKGANLTNWDLEYVKTGLQIDDSVKYEVKYTKDNVTYSSKGEEGYWPYEYDALISALSMLDKDIETFISNQK